MIERLAVALIRLYRLLVSPLLGPACRFFPTCSEYAIVCIQRHGAMRGSWYTARRLCRCHPWGGHGYDPPPGMERAIESDAVTLGERTTAPKSTVEVSSHG